DAASEELDRLRKENATIKDENLNLKIDNRAKEQVINMLNRERGSFLAEIKHQARQIGEMTTKLLQLGAPVTETPATTGRHNSHPTQADPGVEYKVSNPP